MLLVSLLWTEIGTLGTFSPAEGLLRVILRSRNTSGSSRRGTFQKEERREERRDNKIEIEKGGISF